MVWLNLGRAIETGLMWSLHGSQRGADSSGEDGSSSTEPSLEDRFQGLDLHGEEEVGLDFSKELEGPIEGVCWEGLFKVHIPNPLASFVQTDVQCLGFSLGRDF
jgi:hypothetical protein